MSLLIKELDLPLEALDIYEYFADQPHSFWLDSGMDAQRLGRFSFIGANPFLIMRSKGHRIEILKAGKRERLEGNPFEVLKRLLNQYALKRPVEGPPFISGAVGFFSYDLCHFIEELPSRSLDDLNIYDCYFGFYDTVIALDHLHKAIYLSSCGESPAKKIGEMQELLQGIRPAKAHSPAPVRIHSRPIRCNFDREGYLKAVKKAIDYIFAGDIFQVNLSQRFAAEINTSPFQLYKKLRTINPAPFAAFLNFEQVAVACSSPERFLKRSGNLVETRPIKGTRPRGKTPDEDQRLAQELLTSPKDRAENIMIVDLERNDLGRVCQYGSVHVPELLTLERHPTVFHLVSTIQGTVSPDKDNIDIVKACFPGGSITGAPKIRAMEIIDELEPTKRSIYTGAIGYLDLGGQMDLNIAIRTFIIKEKKAYFQVGGGIVADSDPEAEYQETLDKARALIEAVSQG
ncbi:MAG: aminodeoxychorismate synthase, component I [Bacillota bacterium]|nr:aminodeoxychorismate synthase, component I [Bacillota bacterium]